MRPSPIGVQWLVGYAGAYKMGHLRIIATDHGGWDHVSVSCVDRCPTWDEMCRVKDAFFHEEERVVQYHPPKSEYVNIHPYCLHLWRPQFYDLVHPPRGLVV